MAQKQNITKVSISEWMDQESVAGFLNHRENDKCLSSVTEWTGLEDVVLSPHSPAHM